MKARGRGGKGWKEVSRIKTWEASAACKIELVTMFEIAAKKTLGQEFGVVHRMEKQLRFRRKVVGCGQVSWP